MSGQSGGQRLRLSTLNEHLTCKLCGGYFVDATTIIECLHSFCKSCIVKYLENNKYCPVCNAQVHKNKPLLNIRPDQILQDIVYKLVPGCYQNEMRCRKEFYVKHPEEKNTVTSPEARGEPTETHIYSPDESLSLSLEYYSPETDDETDNDKEAALKYLPRRYLRCPAAVTVFHLQKLIRAKYGLSEVHRVDIMYKEEPLCATYTLMDIMYIYHWRRKVPLHLSYRIFESASKRIKMSDDNDEFKQSLSNSNMEVDFKDEEQSIKREWKEVQLKISETGVMSVTDISSLDTKKSTNVNEIKEESGSPEQATPNACSVNKMPAKTEDKEAPKSCTARGRKAQQQQQDNSSKRSEKSPDEKFATGSASAIVAAQNNFKSSEMEVKSIDQRDLSNELQKTGADSGNSIKTSQKEAIQAPPPPPPVSSNAEKNNRSQQVQDKIKTEPASPSVADKRSDGKQQNSTNNNVVGAAEVKTEPHTRQSVKSSALSAGSKINALSAKLQFQPKVGQVNNTYSKKSSPSLEKKRSSSPPAKASEPKSLKTSPKSEVKSTVDGAPGGQTADTKVPTTTSAPNASVAHTQSGPVSTSSVYVTAPSGTVSTPANAQHHPGKNSPQTLAPGCEGSQTSIGLHVPTTVPSQTSLNSWMAERVGQNQKNSPGKSMTVDQQLRSLPGMPQIGKDIVCSTTASGGPVTSMGRISIQTPSMSIYYSSPSKQAASKANYDVTSMYPVPPCPDAIPISLMKSSSSSSSSSTTVNARKDAVSKGTMLNEICDKIRSGSKLGSAESSKDKGKLETQQRGKPELPELLKISKKNQTVGSESPGSTAQVKHIPNIPNVPLYTPSNSQQQQQQMQIGAEAKDSAKRPIATIAPSSQAPIMMTPHQHQMQQKQMSEQSKQSVGAYKTLRFPPKSWNPTLSKNNYVAAKNQAKEMQAAYNAAADGSGVPKQIPSKPPKIFKNKNMPRFLGNPASGVKPMYGVVNEQLKEKEQSSSSKNSPTTLSMTKIDPQTLSPIVTGHNSTMVSPPPYSPTARSSSYQNSPYTRDICQRNSSNPSINNSPRNSPVNMLSTNPFIPSHTPNTNPRFIYFPPTAGYGSDASHLSNPLIRPPIPPPSAFHCSLPPSINKLYQRSGYMAQLQTSVAAAAAAGFSSASGSGQMPATVQRMQPPPPPPPSNHSSSSPTTSSPSSSSSSKSPKTSSASASSTGTASSNMNLARSEALVTTSAASIVDTVALQLAAKGFAQRDSLSVFNLTRTESMKSPSSSSSSSSASSSDAKQTAGYSTGKSSDGQQKSASPNVSTTKQSNASGKTSESKAESMSAAVVTGATATKEVDKKDKNLAKVNGGITVSMPSGEKSKETSSEQLQQQQQIKAGESKNTADGTNKSSSASPSKSTSCKSAVVQEQDRNETKQTHNNTAQSKQGSGDAADAGKTGSSSSSAPGSKSCKTTIEPQKEKATES